MNELSRRGFLAGAATATLRRPANAQATAETVNVGVIGNGIRGTFLVESLLKLPDVKVKALCDVKADRLDRAATLAARDNPATFSDYGRCWRGKIYRQSGSLCPAICTSRWQSPLCGQTSTSTLRNPSASLRNLSASC